MIPKGSYQRTVKAEVHLNIVSEETLTPAQIDMIVLKTEMYLNSLAVREELRPSGTTQIGLRVHFKE